MTAAEAIALVYIIGVWKIKKHPFWFSKYAMVRSIYIFNM